MRKWITATAILVAWAVPAIAQQQKMLGDDKTPILQQIEEKKRQSEDIDRAYRQTVKQTPGGTVQAKEDPWKDVRTAPSTSSKTGR